MLRCTGADWGTLVESFCPEHLATPRCHPLSIEAIQSPPYSWVAVQLVESIVIRAANVRVVLSMVPNWPAESITTGLTVAVREVAATPARKVRVWKSPPMRIVLPVSEESP